MMEINTAKIVAITQPVVDGVSTANDFVAYCARVSNPSNQMNHETSDRLLRYCARNKHWSIFEMVHIVMEINTTRDIARQILRHRSFSFQEFSQRYADPTKDLGFVTREARLQDEKNRQNSISEGVDCMVQYEWDTRQKNLIEQIKKTYDWAIENGFAKEQARAVLPEGLTISKLYTAGTLRSWCHYVDLRSDNGTQKEHREVAINAKKELIRVFPSLEDFLTTSTQK
jgi:thymidylate synthase (FAD)